MKTDKRRSIKRQKINSQHSKHAGYSCFISGNREMNKSDKKTFEEKQNESLPPNIS